MHCLKPYPAMKNSGVPWLGEVPKHWEVKPGRACYREKKIPNAGLKEKTVLSLSYGQIIIRPEEKLHGLVPESFETYQIADPGDIVVRPTDLQNDSNSLRFGLSRHRGIITSAYMCLNTHEPISKEYGYLLLHAYDLEEGFLWPRLWPPSESGLEGLQISSLRSTVVHRTIRHRSLSRLR